MKRRCMTTSKSASRTVLISIMSRSSTWMTVIAICGSAVMATDAENSEIRFQQRIQQETSALAGLVLDRQLSQLQANRLTHLPIYGELRGMRENLGQLSDQLMQEIVASMSQEQPEQQTRTLVRKATIGLMAERQKIRRRLQMAESATAVEKLIELQTVTRARTQQIDSPESRYRESETIDVFHDQTDIKELLRQLDTALLDATQWGGTSSASSISTTEARQVLEGNAVIERAARAAEHIGAKRFSAALPEQDVILASLYRVLQALKRAQGLGNLNLAAALKVASELASEQTALKGETERSNLNRAEVRDSLLKRQREIRESLESLANAIQSENLDRDVLDEANESAGRAETALFESDTERAVESQERVIDSLKQVMKDLQEFEEVPKDASNSSADDDAVWERLEQQIENALDLQEEVKQLAADRPKEAADLERQVGDAVRDSEPDMELMESLQKAFETAKQRIESAEQALRDANEQNLEERLAMTSDAEQALMELAAEMQANASDRGAESKDAQSTQPTNELADGSSSGEPSPTERGESDAGHEERSQESDAGGTQAGNQTIDSRAATDLTDNASVRESAIRRSPWFAELPTALQEAILIKARRPPPVAYADRLRRYFEGR